MQQDKRRRVFGAGLSVKDGEPIYLCCAIKSRVFIEPASRNLSYPSTSKLISSSIPGCRARGLVRLSAILLTRIVAGIQVFDA